jgi:hypothetical protein
MLQVDDLAAARGRARTAGVREVFEVTFDDIAEVHLHPGDMRGAIVSLSEPHPPESWRWGGEDWAARAVPGGVVGITVAVADPLTTAARWTDVAGEVVRGCTFVASDHEPGIVEITVELAGQPRPIRPADLPG